ncbi:MAG: fused signal recognition particle receptor [Bradymonadia bacterium]|jgi:fused signal recognition particle receptor
MVWIVIGVVALLGLGLAARVLGKSKELPAADETRALPEVASEAPVDVLADRVKVAAPVEIRKEMSLKEIKEAKRNRLDEDFLSSAAARAEKDIRKGKVAVAPVVEELVPTTEDLARVETDKEKDSPSPPLGAVDARDSVEPPSRTPETGKLLPDDWDEEDIGTLETEPLPTAQFREELARRAQAEAAAVAAAISLAPEPAAPVSPAEMPTPAPAPAAPALEPAVAPPEPVAVPVVPAPVPIAPVPAKPEPVPNALENSLGRTKRGFVARIGKIFANKRELDADTIEELEEVLFTADIGVRTSQRLLAAVQERFSDGEIELDQVWDVLRAETNSILGTSAGELVPDVSKKPFVLLMVGVNGAGKTTTIGKLAAQYTAEGKSVLMVAGDTFRAAAVNQLVEWATRVGCPIHAGEEGHDPSGVIFDGIKKGIAAGVDVILCDTAGRLQTKKPLMDELGKIVRVANKALPGAPHETVLVIDANTGQNAIQQAQLFREAAPLTGLILTKLDGTAKGGVVIGISEEMKLPIYHIGIGESVTDLRRFDPSEFVEALF